MNEPNRVFDTLAGFRRGAHATQRLAVRLGALAALAACMAAALGKVPAWAAAAGCAPLVLGLAWGLVWRRLVERAFWRGARVPRRGRPVRLPLAALLAAAVSALAALAGPAPAGEPRPVAELFDGRGLDPVALLEASGPGGWAALAMGAAALLVAMYLLFSLWGAHFAPRALREDLVARLAAGDLTGARQLCEDSGSLLARSVAAGLPPGGRAPGPGRALPAARIEAAGRRGAAHWRALVDLLAALGLLAPVAGLFGTVLGLIRVFGAAAAQNPSAAHVAAGAMAALLPAAVALAVSLLALGAHYFADLRLGALTARCEAACMECAAALEDLAAVGAGRAGVTTAVVPVPRPEPAAGRPPPEEGRS